MRLYFLTVNSLFVALEMIASDVVSGILPYCTRWQQRVRHSIVMFMLHYETNMKTHTKFRWIEIIVWCDGISRHVDYHVKECYFSSSWHYNLFLFMNAIQNEMHVNVGNDSYDICHEKYFRRHLRSLSFYSRVLFFFLLMRLPARHQRGTGSSLE